MNTLKHITYLVAFSILGLTSSRAANIAFNFDLNSAAASSNSFGSGITVSHFTASQVESTVGIEEARWQRRLEGGATDTVGFTVNIPEGVTVSFTDLAFKDGIASRQGDNTTHSRWVLSLSAGSASPSAVTNTLPGSEISSQIGLTSQSSSVTLSGLSNITGAAGGTKITFNFTVDFAADPAYSAGTNNNRHAFIDDVILTGEIDTIPEASTVAMLGLIGILTLVRRHR